MHVCMYACMHVCMYVRTYVCMYVCMYPYIVGTGPAFLQMLAPTHHLVQSGCRNLQLDLMAERGGAADGSPMVSESEALSCWLSAIAHLKAIAFLGCLVRLMHQQTHQRAVCCGSGKHFFSGPWPRAVALFDQHSAPAARGANVPR